MIFTQTLSFPAHKLPTNTSVVQLYISFQWFLIFVAIHLKALLPECTHTEHTPTHIQKEASGSPKPCHLANKLKVCLSSQMASMSSTQKPSQAGALVHPLASRYTHLACPPSLSCPVTSWSSEVVFCPPAPSSHSLAFG